MDFFKLNGRIKISFNQERSSLYEEDYIFYFSIMYNVFFIHNRCLCM